MAIATERKTRPVSEQGPDPARQPAAQPWKARWRPRRWHWFAAAGLVAVLLVWLLPAIVAHSPLRNRVLASVAADLKGEVTARSASLGWFSPIAMTGIEVRDEQGQPVLEVPEATGDRSLLAVLWDSSNLGRFQLENPSLSLVLREDGSNLEDVLATYLGPRDEPPSAIQIGLEIVDGTVSITDPRAQQTWKIEQFQLAFNLPAETTGPLKLEASGVVADRQRPGRFTVGLTMHRASTSDQLPTGEEAAKPSSTGAEPAGRDELTIAIEGLPLAMFQPLAARFDPQTQLAGRLSSQIACRFNGQQPLATLAVEGHVTAEDLLLAAAALGTDRVQLHRLHANGRVARQDDRLQVDELVVESDAGGGSVTGTLELGDQSAGELLASLPRQTYEIDGQVDLARLAAILPDTLRIREGTEITSGKLEVRLAGRPGPQGTGWQGRIEASNLTALNRGRQLVWEQPILVTLTAHETDTGPVVDSLRCESDFFKLHAAGTSTELTASASFNLNRLAGRLGEFVDLGGLRLAGDGWAQFNWKRTPAQGFEADGELQVQNLQVGLPDPDRPPWTEDRLVVAVAATGAGDFSSDLRLDTAALSVESGDDRLEARLLQPVLDFREGGTWPVRIEGRGELARWLARIGPWIELADWDLAGSCDLIGEATGSADAIQIRRARLAVRQLQVRGPGLNVLEPQAELVVAGGWDHARRKLELESATLTGNTLAARAENIVVVLPREAPPELVGTVHFQGNLERIQQWTVDPAEPPAWWLQGQVVGKAELRKSGGTTGGKLDAEIQNLVATHKSGQKFQEAKVLLTGQGTYDQATRSIKLERAEVASGTLGGNASGQIALADGPANVQLAGKIDYDMEQLSALMRSYLGEGIRIAGGGSSPVSYRGPLAPDQAEGAMSASWAWADLYGFRVGPANLQATLSEGTLQVQPLDLDVSEGRVRLAPQVRLAGEPMALYLPAGRLAEQVRINPTMCAHALQYVAPVLAGVTTAEGRFSVELDGCRIPLGDLARGELAGRMTVHSVEIGPGPLIQELALVLDRAVPARLTRESVISFQMVDGRVYHRDLEMIFPDLTIRTYGSVGLDRSLALMAEMPVPPKWRGENVLGSALRDQVIRLPIGGTLEKPKIDRRVLEQVSRQFLQNAARNVLEDQLNKQLDRLFRPPQ